MKLCPHSASRFLLRVHLAFATLVSVGFGFGMLAFRVAMTETCHSDPSGVRHLRIRIPYPREIARAGIYIQIFEQLVIAVLLFHLRDTALGIGDIAKDNRFGGASLRTRGGEGVTRNQCPARCPRANMGG